MRKTRHKKYNCSNGCPIEFALEKIGGKWKGVILFHLLDGKKRFSELRKISPNLTQKVLTKQLRELEVDGLVHRKVYAVVPPKVEYSLTNSGLLLRGTIESLEKWGKIHIIENAQ
ncbi:MAG: winged helix-turn-helix transcriptional regulator [Pseudobdellovibrionaceae bacterium]